MKKRFMALAMTALMGLSLVACGDTTASTELKTVEDEEVAASGSDIGSVPTEEDENKIDFIKKVAQDVAPDIDMTDCYTFTDLLNKGRVTAGMGYANVDVGDVNCFFVTSGTYDNLDGNMAGIDATIFTYDDGDLVELGKICSGGTAYPIAAKDGYIYTASNHWICKYVIGDDNELAIMEKASVTYDENGNGTYFYESEDGGDYSNIDSAYAEEIMNLLFEEMGDADIISFDTVVD